MRCSCLCVWHREREKRCGHMCVLFWVCVRLIFTLIGSVFTLIYRFDWCLPLSSIDTSVCSNVFVCVCVCVCVSSRALPPRHHCLPYVWVYVWLDECVSSRFMSCNILRTAEKDKILQSCLRDTVITNLESHNKLLKTGQIGHFIYNTF